MTTTQSIKADARNIVAAYAKKYGGIQVAVPTVTQPTPLKPTRASEEQAYELKKEKNRARRQEVSSARKAKRARYFPAVIRTLKRKPWTSMKELGDALRVNTQTALAIVYDMEQSGTVVRQPNDNVTWLALKENAAAPLPPPAKMTAEKLARRREVRRKRKEAMEAAKARTTRLIQGLPHGRDQRTQLAYREEFKLAEAWTGRAE